MWFFCSLIFAGKVKGGASEKVSDITHKYEARLKTLDTDKHASLFVMSIRDTVKVL
jgi:hypothetical protein